MRVLLGVTGCIGAYKSPEIVRLLRQAGAEVRVILTRAGRWFVATGALQTVSGHPVYTDLFRPRTTEGIEHIDLARQADLLLVAPATANSLAKFAAGLADDFLSTAYLAYRGPVLLAPAMNTGMYDHPAVRDNLETLAARGVVVVGPEDGELACGESGEGRLADPARIVAAALALHGRPGAGGAALRGRQVLVTSGPTRESLDPVRYLSNPSTGRMGHALAEAAGQQGASVVLVSGPTSLQDPPGVDVIRVTTARQMRDAVLARAGSCDLILMAAAVGDYEAVSPSSRKIKKTGSELTVRLRPTPDILQELGRRKNDASRPVLVGFAAETEQTVESARRKLESKNLDYVVANRVDASDAGFGAPTNRVTLITRAGEVEEWPLLSKGEVARRLLERVIGDGLGSPREEPVPLPPERA